MRKNAKDLAQRETLARMADNTRRLMDLETQEAGSGYAKLDQVNTFSAAMRAVQIWMGITSNARSAVLPGSNLIIEQIVTDYIAQFWQNTNDAVGPKIALGKTRGTAVGSNTIAQDNDVLGAVEFWGADGSGAITPTRGAMIHAEVDGSPANNDMPAALVFSTSVDGSGALTERVRITDGGDIGIGNVEPTAMLDINSDTMRLRTAKTPASAGAAGNAGDICWDSSYLYICIATNTWRRVAHATW